MEKLKEHEALGKLDEVFEQMAPEERERALAWLRAKYTAQKAATVTPPLKLEPLRYPPDMQWLQPTIVIKPAPILPEQSLIYWWNDPFRVTCGSGRPEGQTWVCASSSPQSCSLALLTMSSAGPAGKSNARASQ